jgi:nicotinamidase-related amidase
MTEAANAACVPVAMENKNMTASSLDPKAALLVVDLQKAILGLPAVHPIDGIVNKAVALAEAFRARKLPVVLISADGTAPGRAERARGQRVSSRMDRSPPRAQPATSRPRRHQTDVERLHRH